MSKYVVVSFLEENPPHEFSSEEWPLHVTLVRPFETALSQEEILSVLQKNMRYTFSSDHTRNLARNVWTQ